MNFDNLQIDIRQRTHWEAIDLGTLLARKYWRVLFLSWAIPAGTLFVFLSVVLINQAWLVPIIIWWLKPILDKFPLFVLSRLIFNEQISLNSLFKKTLTISRSDILPWLTYRRLSPSRSMDMPVTVLEGLTSEKRSARLQILHRSNANSAFWLTIILFHIETFVLIAAYSFAILMIPDEFSIDYYSILLNENDAHTYIINVVSVLSMMLVAPFYVSSGFCLYLSRRIELEAWDVEIRFRQMAQSFKKSVGAHLVFVPTLICLALFCASPQQSFASEDITESTSTYRTSQLSLEESKTVILEILEQDDFHKYKEVGYWRLKDRNDNEEEEESKKIPQWLINLIKFFERFSFSGTTSFANIFEIVLWTCAIILSAFFIYRLIPYLVSMNKEYSSSTSKESVPKTLFGLDVTKESLPKNIPAETMKLWEQGDHRNALALLYRATLFHLMESKGVQFEEGFTEGECISAARSINDETMTNYLIDLANDWKCVAYAHLIPATEDVDKLCRQWGRLFKDEN